MKNTVFFLFSLLVFLSYSCSTWKREMNLAGKKKEVIMNSIIDFNNTPSKQLRRDSVFVITFQEFDNYFAANISGHLGKFIIGIDDAPITVFPSECLESILRVKTT